MNKKAECGQAMKDQRGLLCHVCEHVIDPDEVTWAYWHEPDREVPLCPEHKDHRDHTCPFDPDEMPHPV